MKYHCKKTLLYNIISYLQTFRFLVKYDEPKSRLVWCLNKFSPCYFNPMTFTRITPQTLSLSTVNLLSTLFGMVYCSITSLQSKMFI